MVMVQILKTFSAVLEVPSDAEGEEGEVVLVAGEGVDRNQRVFISFRLLSFCVAEEEEFLDSSKSREDCG